jgi:hypothetical protein
MSKEMKMKRNVYISVFVIGLLMMSGVAKAAYLTTTPGKIIQTQGHQIAPCRSVEFQDNNGNQIWFRIPNNVNGQDNGIAAVVLAAMIANRTVTINYDPTINTGCGTEPAISYISIF